MIFGTGFSYVKKISSALLGSKKEPIVFAKFFTLCAALCFLLVESGVQTKVGHLIIDAFRS